MKALALAAALAAFPAPAQAWDDQGHRVVAAIAEQYLAPSTARQLEALLALDHAASLEAVAGWAERIRAERPDTASWHAVAIPIHPPPGTPAAYDAARDCPRGDCIVAEIERLSRVLRDQGAAARERLEALKFLVGLVADIHQPMRCAANGDEGGGEVHVIFLGRPTTLRAMWESGILAAAAIDDERAYARALIAAAAPAEVARWRKGSAADWANESYRIARAKIYGEMPYEARTLEFFWESEYLPVVKEQLAKAGVRLAMLLDAALP